MGRSFSAPFTARMLEADQKPYLVLKVEYDGADKYFIDRDTGTFDAAGMRHPTGVQSGLVVDWGVPGQELREMQVGGVDQITIRVEDRGGTLSAIMGETPQQRRKVTIYRMHDQDDVVWPDDAAPIFVGTTKPFSYSESDNVITFEVEDPAKQLAGSVELLATEAAFPGVPEESKDKQLPIPWGFCERVEPILVSKPWRVRIDEPINLAAGTGSRVAIDGHPDELGIPVDVDTECLIGPVDGPDGGAMGLVGKFRQSVDKAKKSSFFEVTGFAGCEYVGFSVAQVENLGTDYAGALLMKSGVAEDDARLAAGARCSFATGSGTFFGRIIGIWSNDTRVLVTFDNPELCRSLVAGGRVQVWYRHVDVVLDSEDPETTPRSSGSLDSLEAGTAQVQRVFYFDQPAGIVGNLVEMFPPPFNMRPAGESVSFPVTALEANTPVPGTYRATVEYARASFPELELRGAGDTCDCGEQSLLPVEFAAGSVLRPVSGSYVYAFAFPCSEVVRIEGFGDVADERYEGRKDFIVIPEQYTIQLSGDAGEAGEAFAKATAWTVDLVDGTWLATYGHLVTTITLTGPPRLIEPRLDSERIWVTVRGIDYNYNTSSTVIYNPAHVLKAYLTHPMLLGLDTSTVDEASFDNAAERAELVDLKVGFAQIERQDGLTLLQDIARQCRSLVFFDQGKFALKILHNDCPNWQATMDEASILQSSLKITETPTEDLVTRLTASWRSCWDDKQKPERRYAVNPGAEDVFVPNSKSLDYWIYHEQEYVDLDIAFWLERWSRIYWVVTVETCPRALVLQPADWIDLGYTDGGGREIVPAGTKCEVLNVKDKAPTNLYEVTARYAKFSF